MSRGEGGGGGRGGGGFEVLSAYLGLSRVVRQTSAAAGITASCTRPGRQIRPTLCADPRLRVAMALTDNCLSGSSTGSYVLAMWRGEWGGGNGGVWSPWGFNGTWGPFGGKPAVHIRCSGNASGAGGRGLGGGRE